MDTVDLNCDLGESFGTYKIGEDEKVFKYITSANIACGFHAGDPHVMHRTVKLAVLNNVNIGAHPGLNDLLGFGRRNMDITPEEAYDIVLYQMGALYGFVKSEGGKMKHVKPHGALYNMAAKDEKLARAVAEAVYKVDDGLILFGPAGSELIKQGWKVGIRVASEVFADRTYEKDGSLTPRSFPDSVISDSDKAVSRVVRMVREGKVMCRDNKDIEIKADTVCIHGDNKKALEFADKINKALKDSSILVKGLK